MLVDLGGQADRNNILVMLDSYASARPDMAEAQ
jgi:hypothetical protein